MTRRATLLTARDDVTQRLTRMTTPHERGAAFRRVTAGRGHVMVRPISATLIVGRHYQWRYDLRRVHFDPVTEANVDANDVDVIGYNAFERGNTDTKIAPGLIVARILAAGWAIYPVGFGEGGISVDMSFPAWTLPNGNGGKVYEFCEENPIDGACAEEE